MTKINNNEVEEHIDACHNAIDSLLGQRDELQIKCVNLTLDNEELIKSRNNLTKGKITKEKITICSREVANKKYEELLKKERERRKKLLTTQEVKNKK